MKNFRIILLVVSFFFLGLLSSKAQIGISVNFNVQPQWGPVNNDYVEYYYLPEYDIYYNAPQRQFIYLNGPNWIFSNSLPYRYRNVDLYRTYKVVINEPKPYLRHDYYYGHYKQYKNVHSKQGNIRDSRDPKYARENNRQEDSGNGRFENSGNRDRQSGYRSNESNREDQGNRGKEKREKGNKGERGNKGNKDRD
jgi:hypothetical protein